MRILFMGTPEIAARCLEGLLDAGMDVAAVITQPDRPAGRGMKLAQSAVKTLATSRGIAVHQPVKIRKCADLLAAIDPEIIVVAAYGRILPRYILDYPKYGCVNMHTSLLPRWRGAAPIQRAIQAGDRLGGVCTMYMSEGMDEGDVIYTAETPIDHDDTGGSLHDRYAVMGAELLVRTLRDIEAGVAPRTNQDGSLVTLAPPIDRAEGHINWNDQPEKIRNLVRAFNPYPTAFAYLDGVMLKIYHLQVGNGEGAPGEVLSVGDGLEVAAGDGSVVITELQEAGKRRMSANDWLRGKRLAVGTMLN